MRILLSYPSESDQGEGVHIARVLRRLGHEVHEINASSGTSDHTGSSRIIRGYPTTVTVQDLLNEYGASGLYLYVEPLGLIPRGMECSPIPTACVISDVHRNLRARIQLAKFFDRVFVYQRNYVTRFTDHDTGAICWLPYACDPEFFYDLGVDRDIEIAFIGKIPRRRCDRKRFIEELARRYRMNEQRYYLQREIPHVYSRAKIVVNIPMGDDLNFRCFEAMSCGAMLLTRRIANGQEELFKEDTHYVAFGSERELCDKVEYYLKNEDERKQIASVGHDAVMLHHTLPQRVKTLLELVQNGPERSAPVRTLRKEDVLKLYASVYERSGRVEAILRLAAEQEPGSCARFQILAMGVKSFLRRAVLRW